MLSATAETSKSIKDLSEERGIPIATAYRKVEELKRLELLVVDQTILKDDGKHLHLFKSNLGNVTIKYFKGKLDIHIEFREKRKQPISEAFVHLWDSVVEKSE